MHSPKRHMHQDIVSTRFNITEDLNYATGWPLALRRGVHFDHRRLRLSMVVPRGESILKCRPDLLGPTRRAICLLAIIG